MEFILFLSNVKLLELIYNAGILKDLFQGVQVSLFILEMFSNSVRFDYVHWIHQANIIYHHSSK
jgi:hypothetical protein